METLCSTTPTRDKPTREKLRWAVNSTNLPTISLWAAIWPLCIGDRMGSSLCCLAKRWPLAFCGTSIGRSTSRLTASHSPSLTGQRLQCDCFQGALFPVRAFQEGAEQTERFPFLCEREHRKQNYAEGHTTRRHCGKAGLRIGFADRQARSER